MPMVDKRQEYKNILVSLIEFRDLVDHYSTHVYDDYGPDLSETRQKINNKISDIRLHLKKANIVTKMSFRAPAAIGGFPYEIDIIDDMFQNEGTPFAVNLKYTLDVLDRAIGFYNELIKSGKSIPEEQNIKSNKRCGSLSKESCDQIDFIRTNLKDNNIFLDIPYVNYEKQEQLLRKVAGIAKIILIVAKDKITSNDMLCKVCRLIQTCKYGLADISFDRHSVSYELGLMHGLGISVCILLQGSEGKFSDISGIEHQTYQGEKTIAIKFGEWILQNISEIDKDSLSKFIENEKRNLREQGEIQFPMVSAKSLAKKPPEFDILLQNERKQFGSASGLVRGYYDINYSLTFRIRNKSDITICLENVRVENDLLGDGKIDTTNPRLSKLPFNIDPHRTEEIHLNIAFPNEINSDEKGKDFKLEIEFDFADRTIKKEVVAYL